MEIEAQAKLAAEAPSSLVRGKQLSMTSTSGRTVEFRLAGRCGAIDPWLLYAHGMCPKFAFPASAVIAGNRPDGKMENTISAPFRIVCVARPGYDGSTQHKPPGEMTYEDQAIDILALMDHLGAAKFAVQGHSSGGNVALSVAHMAPDRVTAVSLLDCDASYGPGFPKGKMLNEPLAEGAPVTYVDNFSKFRPGSWCFTCCCSNPLCCFCACCVPRGLLMDLQLEIGRVPYRLEEIRCPVQIIGASQDYEVDPNVQKFFLSKLPNARLEVVEGMGHIHFPTNGLWDEKMHELYDLVQAALQSAPGQSKMA